MFGIGFGELLLVMVIGLFLFGNRLPEMARAFGKTITAFRKEVRGLEEEVRPPLR
jgi:sec-independent protein translocase protein TatA